MRFVLVISLLFASTAFAGKWPEESPQAVISAQIAHKEMLRSYKIAEEMGNGTVFGAELSEYQIQEIQTVWCVYKESAMRNMDLIDINGMKKATNLLIAAKNTLGEMECNIVNGKKAFISVEDYERRMDIVYKTWNFLNDYVWIYR